MAASLARGGYRLLETTPFRDALDELQPTDQARLTKKLLALAYPALQDEPRSGPWIKRLKGYHPETWRFRVGPWRIFYEIDEERKIVKMTALELRRDAYR